MPLLVYSGFTPDSVFRIALGRLCGPYRMLWIKPGSIPNRLRARQNPYCCAIVPVPEYLYFGTEHLRVEWLYNKRQLTWFNLNLCREIKCEVHLLIWNVGSTQKGWSFSFPWKWIIFLYFFILAREKKINTPIFNLNKFLLT